MEHETTSGTRPSLPSNDSLATREKFFGDLLENACLPAGMEHDLAFMRDETPGPGFTNEGLCHVLIQRRPEVLEGRKVEDLLLPEVVKVFEAVVIAERNSPNTDDEPFIY